MVTSTAPSARPLLMHWTAWHVDHSNSFPSYAMRRLRRLAIVGGGKEWRFRLGQREGKKGCSRGYAAQVELRNRMNSLLSMSNKTDVSPGPQCPQLIDSKEFRPLSVINFENDTKFLFDSVRPIRSVPN
jgi:hypothetical protein